MPHQSDAAYFMQRAATSRTASAHSSDRDAAVIHGQLAHAYDRLQAKAQAVDDARAADSPKQTVADPFTVPRKMDFQSATSERPPTSQGRSQIRKIGLKTYIEGLCRNISAALLDHPVQSQLEIQIEDGLADPDIAICLGLIVTELFLNATKRFLERGRNGQISINYRSTGHGWILSVSDVGTEMGCEVATAVPRLGVSIVDALARRLHAHVVIESSEVGTIVSVCHG